MLSSLRRLAVELAELCEAEGALARYHLDRLGQRLLLLVMAAAAVSAGVALISIGAYLALAEAIGPSKAMILVGLAVGLLGIAVFAVSSQLVKTRR